jgi:seryl-tRNA synthetase
MKISIALKLFFLTLLTSSLAFADKAKLGKALGGQLKNQQNAAQSQKKVDGVDDKTQDLLREYRLVLRKIESTKIYNEQLQKLIQNQEDEKVSIRNQIDDVNVTNQEIVPLMLSMVQNFRKLVTDDVPFLVDERRNRAGELEGMMNRADVSTSEKFRRIMDAYQIENDYGRTIEAYRSVVVKDGKDLTVDFLRVGRLSFIYQTLDGANQAIWNHQKKEWLELGSDYRRPVREALRVARKQTAPDILSLPVYLVESK